MSLKYRLKVLERRQPKQVTLDPEERLRRINYLLTYQGTDPDMLTRKRRVAEILATFRARQKEIQQ